MTVLLFNRRRTFEQYARHRDVRVKIKSIYYSIVLYTPNYLVFDITSRDCYDVIYFPKYRCSGRRVEN